MRPLQFLAVRARAPHAAAARPFVAAVAAGLWLCPAALAAPPPPCNGVAQVADVAGDGHHANTDVSSAWFSEAAGGLQAVVKVVTGDWRPMHVDSTTASWSLLFEVGGQQHYVRLVADKSGALAYDYGTWTLAGGFVSAGPTTGAVTPGPGGTVTIDVPAQTGATAGTVLARPFVLTYESDPAEPGPVDRGPGGVTAGEAAFGADYVVGSCQPPGAGGAGTPEAPAGGGPARTTAVVLAAPQRVVGARRVRARGRVVPGRGGVHVQVTTKARGSAKTVVRSGWTLADGSFSVSVPVSETSTVTAVAEQINAQTLTVLVQSKVGLTLRRVAGGRTVASGLVMPRLPGRVLLLRTNAAIPSARTLARNGHFRFAARRLARGRYQAVFIPSGQRAERSTSRPRGLR